MPRPLQRVWEALNDPEILRASIPGCQSLVKEAEDRFSATVQVKVGPIDARFKGGVSLADLDPPHGYTLILDGNGGIAGSAKGSAKVRLSEEAGNTRVAWDIDAQVGGRMAQLGGPIIDATAKQLAGKFFGRFGEIVGGAAQPAAAPTAAAATLTPCPVRRRRCRRPRAACRWHGSWRPSWRPLPASWSVAARVMPAPTGRGLRSACC